MPKYVHQNPHGDYVHGCNDCGAALRGYYLPGGPPKIVAWICKCRGPQTTHLPTVSIGPRPPQLNLVSSLPREPLPKLGDRVESALETIGVTKDRWKSFKSLMGLPATCNCESRKVYLNKLGDELGEAARKAVAAIVGG